MHRGEPTAVFKAIVHAYQRGATLVAVGGAGSALCTNMIVEGSSRDALEHGASSDAGHGGVVIEEGFGLFDYGIADQNLLDRRRLGRLIVACAEQNVRYGFGICEESGLIVGGSTASMHAIGRLGFVVAELDPTYQVPDEILDAVRTHLRHGDTPAAGNEIPDEVLDRFAFAGTPDEVADQAGALFAAGADRVEFGTPHGATPQTGIDLLGTQVIPRLRS